MKEKEVEKVVIKKRDKKDKRKNYFFQKKIEKE